jgi:hypothetical protein
MKLLLFLLPLIFLSSCEAIHNQQYSKLTVSEKEIYDNLNSLFSHKDRMDIIKTFNGK